MPRVGVDTLRHITEALDVGWLGMGKLTLEFETRIAEYLGLTNRYVVATNTGTSALHIALEVAGVGPGHEVITPSFNYVADHQAIRMCGANVVMCDIRETDLGIDVEKAEELITERTKAVVPLSFAGVPCDLKGTYELAKKHQLRVIEDDCHGFGTTIDERKLGSFGDVACFSFDPVKIVTSIDGGCVIVNTEDELRRLHHLRLLGVDKDTTLRYQNNRAWDYDVVDKGFRYHLNSVMAAVGISQLKRVDEFIHSRRTVCTAYNKAFSGVEGLIVPNTDFANVSPFIYSVRILDGRRDALIEHLRARAIDVGIHFVPVHKHSAFTDATHGDMTVTDRVTNEVVTLPLHSGMESDDVERVVEGVCSFFG